MKLNRFLFSCFIMFMVLTIKAQITVISDSFDYKLYPVLNNRKVELPSPFLSTAGIEYVIALNYNDQYAIIPVSLRNDRGICTQLFVDTLDFPSLGITGLHEEKHLNATKHITGRSIERISEFAMPGALSTGGFLAADEDIISVLVGDNRLVSGMGLTHPELAKCLFHVLNMMDEDLKLERWNMAKHQWDNIKRFYYNNKLIQVKAWDTKGGQLSIFNDGITGAFHVRLWREISESEEYFLEQHYRHLNKQDFEKMKNKLSLLNIGEMQPQYIMRYGFYEGHTYWRADPVAIAFIFGLKDLKELHEVFSGRLDRVLLGLHISHN